MSAELMAMELAQLLAKWSVVALVDLMEERMALLSVEKKDALLALALEYALEKKSGVLMGLPLEEYFPQWVAQWVPQMA